MENVQRLTASVLTLFVLVIAPTAVHATTTEQDTFLRGYAAAVLEREFRLKPPSLRVQYGVITLDAADLAGADRERVVEVLSSLPGVARVAVRDAQTASPAEPPRADPTPTDQPRIRKQLDLGLLPGGQLFDPLIADPRWPHFAAAHHYYLNDRDFKNVGAVSFGETFAIYRDRLGFGLWEFGIQAGVFAIFDLDADSKDLINADYFVGIPVSYRYRDLSVMARVFHQSSHLGDEFLLRNRLRGNRVNLSYEQVDAKVSYDFHESVRAYIGAGYLFDQDPSSLDPWSTQVGLEFRSPWPKDSAWRPIAAVDIQHRQENDWHTDFSLRAGVQHEGVLATRKVQLLLEYFRGHSPNGQFFERKIDYLGLGVHLHF
jgi:hypothetical protein